MIHLVIAIIVLAIFQSNGAIEWLIAQSYSFELKDMKLYIIQALIMVFLLFSLQLTKYKRKHQICGITGISLMMNFTCILSLWLGFSWITNYYNAVDNLCTLLILGLIFHDGIGAGLQLLSDSLPADDRVYWHGGHR